MRESEPQALPTQPDAGAGLKRGILVVAVIGVAALLYACSGQGSTPQSYASLAKGGFSKKEDGRGLNVEGAGHPAPATVFVDSTGKIRTLADFKGKPLLVNLWATWCGPCVKEMPTLAALQKKYAGKVEVVALSIDSAKDSDKAKAFIAKNAPLAFYQDTGMKLPFAFDPTAQGYPSTMFYGRDGIERARMVGEADWASPEASAVVDRLLKD